MTADRARGALAVLQDADGKFICEVPCGYIVEQTASAHKPRRIQAQRRRRAMLRRRVALTVALLTVAALLAALMPWSGSGAADKPRDTTANRDGFGNVRGYDIGGIVENKPVYLDFEQVAAVVRVFSDEKEVAHDEQGASIL